MKFLNVFLLILFSAALNLSCANKEEENMNKSVYDFTVETIDGEEISLDKYKGKTILIVNVASKCGFTPQYEGLQELYEKYKDKDFYVLGFPCNQFGNQEPGSEEDIKEFCSTNFDVNFPMFSKIEVNGDDAHPLYKFLKEKASGTLGTKSIKWNFTKFLIDKEGNIVDRYGSAKTPKELDPIVAKYVEK